MSAHAPAGAMLARQLSWTLRAPRASPAPRRSAVAASRRAAPSSSAGGDEPPKAVKTKRRVVRRLADSNAGSVADPTPAAPAVAPKAAREKTAPGAASARDRRVGTGSRLLVRKQRLANFVVVLVAAFSGRDRVRRGREVLAASVRSATCTAIAREHG